MKLKVENNTGQELNELLEAMADFYPYAQKRLKFDKPVDVRLQSDKENSKSIYGKTAYYDPEQMSITIYVDRRHPKDMLRSFSHELVHHAQNCRGDFNNLGEYGADYAQKNPHLRKLEGEAYLLGNGYLIRDWEDQKKHKLNKESKKMNMQEKIYAAMVELLKDEGIDISEVSRKDHQTRVGGRDAGGRRLRPMEEEEISEEDVVEEEENNVSEGELPPGLKAYQDKKKGKKGDKSAGKEEKSKNGKPFGDSDGDGKPNVLDKDADDADVQEEDEDKEKKVKHKCASHVKENVTGREGKCINHTLLEDGTVTHYTVEFENEIVENIPVSKLALFNESMHNEEMEHMQEREDYEHDTTKPRREHLEEVNESFKQQKDNLLFEALKDRWCK
jgi:hypothetical protein